MLILALNSFQALNPKRFLLFFSLGFWPFLGFSQSGGQPVGSKYIRIQKVIIEGLKKTRPKIVRRELSLLEDSVIAVNDTAEAIKWQENRVWNTRLFTLTKVNLIPAFQYQLVPDTLVCDLHIRAIERWYLFPIPIFELADRSFNEWWYNQNRSLSRVNYGIRLYRYNLTGNNDPLKFTFQLGFLRRFDLNYQLPYFDKKQRHGFKLNFSHSTNLGVAIQSVGNKQDFVQDNKTRGRIRNTVGLGYSFRKNFYAVHNAELKWCRNRISDTLSEINPNYFGEGRKTQRYFEFSYDYTLDKRDHRNYPLHGYLAEIEFEQVGLLPTDAVKITALRMAFAKYFELTKSLFWACRTELMTSVPAKQPYYNIKALGFGERYVRGYDRNVIEGTQAVLFKSAFRKRLVSFSVDYRKILPISSIAVVPITIYLKANTDMGFMHNPFVTPANRPLTNDLLLGGGPGLDIVTYYDVVWRLEYSFNRQGGNGFFVSFRTDL